MLTPMQSSYVAHQLDHGEIDVDTMMWCARIYTAALESTMPFHVQVEDMKSIASHYPESSLLDVSAMCAVAEELTLLGMERYEKEVFERLWIFTALLCLGDPQRQLRSDAACTGINLTFTLCVMRPLRELRRYVRPGESFPVIHLITVQ